MAGMCRALTIAVLVVLLYGGLAMTMWVDLPPELQMESSVKDIRMRFCSSCVPLPLNWQNQSSSLCQQICDIDGYRQCRKVQGNRFLSESRCEDEGLQSLWCGYLNANVCRYEDGRGSCIYNNVSKSERFCQCRDENGGWSGSRSRRCTVGTNVAAAVLGSVLSVVLLVNLGIGVFYFWGKKRNNPQKQTPKPEENRNMYLGGNFKVDLPEPPVCGDDQEYAYVDERWRREPAPIPTEQPQKVENSTQNHLVNNDSKEEKMIKNDDHSAEPPPSDLEYFVLKKKEGGETDETDGYQSLIKNGDQGSGNSGYEVARSEGATTEDLSDDVSSYDHLDRATVDKPSNEGALTKVDEQDDYNHIK